MKLAEMTDKWVFILFLFITFLGAESTAQNVVDSTQILVYDSIARRSFSSDFDTKYTQKEFDYSETKYKPNLWQKFKIWLAEQIQKIFAFSNPGKSMEIVMWVLKIGGIFMIVWALFKIISSFINNKESGLFGRTSQSIDIHAKDLEYNLLQTDFESFIQKAVDNKQYRLAIRYYYLLVLKKLTLNQKIKWEFEKTNLQYYHELQPAELQSQFKYISYLYEYCWYGEFELNESEFNLGEKSFNNFIKSI